jgi:hypothetical protein
MALTERVVLVAFDREYLATLMFDFEAAHGFADITGPVVGLGLRGSVAHIKRLGRWFYDC